MQKLKRGVLSVLLGGVLSLVLSGLTCVSWALVPGPILLQDKTLKALQNDEKRALKAGAQRAKNQCLTVATQRFCLGYPQKRVETALTTLSEAQQKRVLFYYHYQRLQGILVFFPVPLGLPLTDEALEIGQKPLPLKEFTAAFDSLFLPQPIEKHLTFGTAKLPADVTLHYNAQRHLGALVHRSQQGDFVIGLLLTK